MLYGLRACALALVLRETDGEADNARTYVDSSTCVKSQRTSDATAKWKCEYSLFREYRSSVFNFIIVLITIA